MKTANVKMGNRRKTVNWGEILLIVSLIVTILAGAYLRLVGVNWDDHQHLHPDERFLSMVQVAISPVEDFSTYFDTATSSLNPANRGYSFFVYGTLPIFIVRYIGESLGQTDYNAITIVGRQVSAVFDLFTILLVFAIGKRLYNKWVGLLSALFYALAVLPIQLSHFMTVDTITNTFSFLAVYAAVWALRRQPAHGEENLIQSERCEEKNTADNTHADETPGFDFSEARRVLKDLAPYILFGIALGAATASKINAVVIAMILPLVEGMRYFGMEADEKNEAIFPIIRNLAVAGFLSFLVFRIGQPYAFNGPGFLNIGINENWWTSLQNLRAQASGDVDFPPALQWARRPITFSWTNLTAWGLGWPLGLFVWLSYLWMGWLILRKKDWRLHFPLWTFTGLHFVWQSFSWVRSMRYQMLIYPALAIIAGWGLVKLVTAKKAQSLKLVRIKPRAIRVTGILLTIIIVLGTAAWAYAFTRIYTRPHTRVEASRWIYQNIPGALTLHMKTANGDYQRPLMYRAGDNFEPGEIYRIPFYAAADGMLQAVNFPHILDQAQEPTLKVVQLTVRSALEPEKVLASAWIDNEFLPTENERRGAAYEFFWETPIPISEGDLYYLQLELIEGDSPLQIFGSPLLNILTFEGMGLTQPLPRILQSVRAGRPYTMNNRLMETGVITEVSVPYLVDQAGVAGLKGLTINLQLPDQEGASSTGYLQSEFLPGEDIRGGAYIFKLDEPLQVEAEQMLVVTLTTETEGAQLVLRAPTPALESSWDDAIPYPVLGFSPYSDDGGIYRNDLNFEMYWPDDEQKLTRFETNLDLADYIFITSNRQWGTTTRVPERYLLTTAYYRNLLGCPVEKDVVWCYSVAEPNMFEGALGFELVETFHSNPNLGSIEFNTQFAEEAFTVYDHPKVLIFEKTDAYDPIEMRQMIRSVDLSKVVFFTPGDAASYRGPDPGQHDEPRHNLMLPEDRLEEQREGGTWSVLFDPESLLNTSHLMAAAAFYLFVMVLGVLCYPLVRLALPGLADRGYPLAKLAGLLLLAFFVWVLGSLGVAFTAKTILIVLLGMIVFSLVLVLLQKDSLWVEVQKNWRYFLTIEILALIAFAFFLLIRLGNPDLWHPFKGGEKPMDFSYLNAVLRSTTFPPYDPWFAGGYINYYYFGFVLVGVPIKLLGIIPAIAYNIVLSIWFSILILSAFSVGWNLYLGIPRSRALRAGETDQKRVLLTALGVGLATAIGLAVVGNLGTLRLISSGYQRIAAGGLSIDEASLGQQISWTFQGFIQFIRGTPMPFYPGDWYWVPSRVIPGEPITEFPFFTFIYADLHAHLIAFPITVFATSWSLSVVLNKAKWGEKDGRLKWVGGIAGFALGGLVIGALLPTNTWDFYTYFVFAAAALFYSILKNYRPGLNLKVIGGVWLEKFVVALGSILMLLVLVVTFYQPFIYWFGQGYTQVAIWEGSRTPMNAYFIHWGLFLFVIASWMGWESYHWMKTTPQSALKKLYPYLTWIYAVLILFFIALIIFLIQGITVALVAVPLGLWVILLMLRPGQSDGRRFLLFMIGTALMLTLVVEQVHIVGDIGRMNTVFKFYLQAWILFALSAGVCLGWLIKSLRYWNYRLSFFWQAILYILVVSALLFTVMGTMDKIRDRMAPEAPQSLDGMAYMAYATYYDKGVEMELVEDYHAIRWMQENVVGSPVILEGQAFEYRWGNRFTIYTGLPGVVGWNWHQRQQRAILRSDIVQQRVDAVDSFYQTEDQLEVIQFIEQYDLAYIVLGQLERNYYDGPGLEKFELYEGQLWNEVYRVGNTIIYQVLN